MKVTVSEADGLKESLTKYKDYICAEILADELEFSSTKIDGISIDINEVFLNVIVSKKG